MRNRARFYAVVASICLHILFFLLRAAAMRLNLLATTPEAPEGMRPEPLVFDIVPPREVVETPEDAPVVDAPEAADYLSDRNARARNAAQAPDLEAGAAFSRGDLDVPEIPRARGAEATSAVGGPPEREPETPAAGENAVDERDAEERYADLPRPRFPRELLDPRKTRVPAAGDPLPHVEYDNRLSVAAETGGLTFNTYDWDFAPYMIGLKRKIERNVIPPLAFSPLGMIEGETVVRFRIDAGGRLRSLEVLGYTGHESLMVTSRRAVESSAPFALLPPDFPEEYLEVTARFSYHAGPQRP